MKKSFYNRRSTNSFRRDTADIPSADCFAGSANSTAKQNKCAYSGEAVLGIVKMHKSNYVPVTTKEATHDVTNMRRNSGNSSTD